MAQQYNLPLPTAESFLAEDFFPAESNAEAIRWVLDTEASAWPSPALIVFGPEGCGKTHLLQAWAEKNKAFLPDFGDASLSRLVNDPESCAAIAIDDAHDLAGSSDKEEWLQHVYNAARAARAPLLLTSRTPPAAWGLRLPDILSRLKSCLAVGVREPDDSLMRILLIKQFSDRQLRVEDGVIEYLARRLDRTGSCIRQAVHDLDRQALTLGHKISIPFAQSILWPAD